MFRLLLNKCCAYFDHNSALDKKQSWTKTKDRPNFGFRFRFGAERVDFNTFGIVSVSVESSRGTFGNISVSAAVMLNFGGHRKQVRSSDTVNRCSKSIGCAGQLYADRQSNLLGENAEKLLFLAYNIRLLDFSY